MAISIKPLEDRIVVKANEAEQKTASGLVMPDTAKEKPQEGTVMAVGPGRFENGVRLPLDIKEGDVVLYSKYGGTEVKYNNEEYLVLSSRDVLAIIAKRIPSFSNSLALLTAGCVIRRPSLYLAQNLSLRLASVEMINSLLLIPAAIASSEQTSIQSISAASAKLCAKAMPTLRPVNGPGPMPTATKSILLFSAIAWETSFGRTSP